MHDQFETDIEIDHYFASTHVSLTSCNRVLYDISKKFPDSCVSIHSQNTRNLYCLIQSLFISASFSLSLHFLKYDATGLKKLSYITNTMESLEFMVT